MHKYAVLDRINLSSFDDKPCQLDIGKVRLGRSMLPSKQDSEAIRQNMATLVARVKFIFYLFFNIISGRYMHDVYIYKAGKGTIIKDMHSN